MALFDGVQNFTPAFTGQQLAIQSGQGAGQSISRGMQTAQRGKAQDLNEREFEFNKKKYEDMIKQLKLHDKALSGALSGSGPTDYGNPNNVPVQFGGNLMTTIDEQYDFFILGKRPKYR